MKFDPTYCFSENRFYFPAAFAIGSAFDPKRKRIENMGGIGTLIGHEFGHALDISGSEFDEFGKRNPILNEQDRVHFQNLSKAFVEYFDQIGHNGEQTVQENQADLIGLTTAFHAAFAQDNDNEQRKVFFTSYARLWCTSMSDGYRESHLKSDSHALPESRVNEPLKSMPEFAEAFSCETNSKMVLPKENRLQVW